MPRASAKGGIDAVSARERYPRVAELPFDAAYKLMATFRTMNDASGREDICCFVEGAPDQLLARAATAVDADTRPVQADGGFRQRFLAENQRLGEQGLRVIATARGPRPGGLRPRCRPAPAGDRAGAARPGRDG
jgi:P-type Ca2+ transporter type 2C